MPIKIMSILLLFVILISADKALTMWNLSVLKDQGQANFLDAEKNIAAKWFFEKCGLLWGSLLFGLVTLGTLSLCYWGLKSATNDYTALWIIFLIYGAVLGGNTFQLIKNYKLI
jgi:hypothetical protein